jgi:site-specific DNA recombinase
VTGAHAPLVDEATFNLAGTIMDSRGEDHTRRASNNSDYHLTGRIRCPKCGKALIGTNAHGRNKVYRYYVCWNRARYGTDTCDAHRINADAMDEAIFDSLTGFYRHHHELIEQAVTQASTQHSASLDHRRAELTALDARLTRATTAIDRYLQAFEDGELDPATVKERMSALRTKTTQLTIRRDQLADELSEAPVVPPAMVLDELTDHIAEILRSGNPAQRKTLIEALVAEVKITGPNTIVPVFRVPQPDSSAADPETNQAVAALPATTAQGRMVRTMIGVVGDTGIEPATSPV